jgi:hypothetical protein
LCGAIVVEVIVIAFGCFSSFLCQVKVHTQVNDPSVLHFCNFEVSALGCYLKQLTGVSA